MYKYQEEVIENIDDAIYTRRYSRGERSPLLPLEQRPDYLGETGMGSRDPCRPCRGKLGPGHKPK